MINSQRGAGPNITHEPDTNFTFTSNQQDRPTTLSGFGSYLAPRKPSVDPPSTEPRIDSDMQRREHWIPDSKAKECSNPSCCKQFGFINRRHHCRACCFVFCKNCTIQTNIGMVKGKQSNMKNPQSVRICTSCHRDLEVRNNLQQNQINQQRVNQYREKNLMEMNSEDIISQYSENQQIKEEEKEDDKSEYEVKDVSGKKNKKITVEDEDDEDDEEYKRNYLDGQMEKSIAHDSSVILETGMSDNFQDNKMENHARMKKLKDLSKKHIIQIVEDQIQSSGIENWSNYLHKFVIQAVDSVKPSSRYLKDSMDFNKFVEIQLLDHKDESKSQYINGCVFMKNLADKRMPRQFTNPKILLLKGSLGFLRDLDEDGDQYMDINSVINQEEHYVQILEEKIKLISPNVIVTEKDISFKILEVLRNNEIAAITNLNIDKMKKLARLTKTIIAPSANVIDKNFQMGRCAQFRVLNPENPTIGARNRVSSLGETFGNSRNKNRSIAGSGNYSIFEKKSTRRSPSYSYYSNLAEIDSNKQIIFFEGCNPVLGCTIILSGPFKESDDILSASHLSGFFKLLKVQWQLRKMLHMSRNVILEREMLYQLKINPQVEESPYLVTRNIKNRSTLVLYKVMIKKGQQTLKNEQNRRMNDTINQDSIDNSHVETISRKGTKSKKTKSIFAQSNTEDKYSSSPPNLRDFSFTPGDREQEKKQIDENFVKTKFDSMCGQPKKIKFQFYNINLNNYDLKYSQESATEAEPYQDFLDRLDMHVFEKDETLGSFLVRIAQQSEKNRDAVASLLNQQQKQYEERSQSTQYYGMSNSNYDPTLIKQAFGGLGPSRLQHFNPSDRKCHILQCTHKTCKDQLNKHIQSFYHKDGNLDIQIQPFQKNKPLTNESRIDDNMTFEDRTHNESVILMHQNQVSAGRAKAQLSFQGMARDLDKLRSKNVKNWHQIFMSSKCNKCNFQGKKILLSDTLFEYSISRFIEQYFYNNKLRYAEVSCDHCPLRDHTRFFHMADGSTITFKFTKQDIYSIDILNLKKQNNNLSEVIKFCIDKKQKIESLIDCKNIKFDNQIHQISVFITQQLKGIDIQFPISDLDTLEPDSLLEKLHQMLKILQDQISIIDKSFQDFKGSVFDALDKVIQDLEKRRLNFCKQKHFTPQDMLKMNFIERKFMVNYLSFDSVIKQYIKSVCVVITLIELRQQSKQVSDENLQFVNPTLQSFYKYFPKLMIMSKNNLKVTLDQEDLQLDQEFFVQNQLHEAAIFFLMKSKPPMINSQQIIDFLRAFYGGSEPDLSENELKYLYNLGYKQLIDLIKSKLKEAMKQKQGARRPTNSVMPQTLQEDPGLKKGVNSLFLPLGSDNGLIEVHPDDNASIIAYALNSNLYKEALIKNNYLESQQKAKQLIQQQNENKQNKQVMKLSHQDDIFNYEFEEKFIETELLCGEQQRLSFALSFSSYKDESSIQIQKHSNNNYTEIKQDENSIMFNTFKQIKQTTKKQENLTIQEQAKYRDLNLQTQILKEYSINFLDKKQEDSIFYQSILVLQNKVYNQIYSLFFDNNNIDQQQQLQAQYQKYQQQNQNQTSYQKKDNPQVLVGGGFGGGVGFVPQNQTIPRQNSQTQSQKITKDSKVQLNLFGIRKPADIFHDHEYKQRILTEEVQNLQTDDSDYFSKMDYNVKLYFPKKFEVLRKFYCGSHLNFVQSMMSSDSWKDVTGGKTQSPFQKTFDQKFVMKEVKRQELKMFLEFAPQYFDYLCKSFFHDYPCTLAKIVGVYKIKINKYIERVSEENPIDAGIIDPDDESEYVQSCLVPEKNQKVVLKTIKKYVFVSENLNYGLTEEDEKNLIRYDLKGSTLNRFVQDQEQIAKQNKLSIKKIGSYHNLNQADAALLGYLEPFSPAITKDVKQNRVYHDNNFIYEMGARPLPMQYNMNKILNICVNNDTLCLAKSQIIDYSLLVIINMRTRKLRFAIIDYVQHYTLEKMLETRFKKFWKGNEPTIIEPEKYKKRFKKAIKKYFIAMCHQNEILAEDGSCKTPSDPGIIKEIDVDDEEDHHHSVGSTIIEHV